MRKGLSNAPHLPCQTTHIEFFTRFELLLTFAALVVHEALDHAEISELVQLSSSTELLRAKAATLLSKGVADAGGGGSGGAQVADVQQEAMAELLQDLCQPEPSAQTIAEALCKLAITSPTEPETNSEVVCQATVANLSPHSQSDSGAAETSVAKAKRPEEQTQLLGEQLFPLISDNIVDYKLSPVLSAQMGPFVELAGKVTGMLLELDDDELLPLFDQPEALSAKVMEAIDVLHATARAQHLPSTSSQDAAGPPAAPSLPIVKAMSPFLSVTEGDGGQIVTCMDREGQRMSTEWDGVRFDIGVPDLRDFCRDNNKPMGFYYEIFQLTAGICRIGWSTRDASLRLATDALGVGYGGTGKKSHCGQFTKYGQAFGAGDTIGCLLAFVPCTHAGLPFRACVQFYKNGVSFGEAWPDSPIEGKQPLFPTISVCKGCQVHVNFGSSPSMFDEVPKINQVTRATWLALSSMCMRPASGVGSKSTDALPAVPIVKQKVLVHKKTAASKLGLVLKGDVPSMPPYIDEVKEGGLAAGTNGLLHAGQTLHAVNGIAVQGHENASKMLKEAVGDVVLTVSENLGAAATEPPTSANTAQSLSHHASAELNHTPGVPRLLSRPPASPPLGFLSLLRESIAPILIKLVERMNASGGALGDGAAGASREVVIDHLLGVLQDAPAEQPLLERLATAERLLLSQLRVRTFEQLGLDLLSTGREDGGDGGGSSFAGFCADHAGRLEALLPCTTSGLGDCRTPALQFLSFLLRSTPQLSAAASWALVGAHFDVCTPEELGWGSIEELHRCAASSVDAPLVPVPVASHLTDVSGSEATAVPLAGPMGPMSVDDALRAIRCAPPLFSLATALHWRECFAPSLGPLAAFLTEQRDALSATPLLEVTRTNTLPPPAPWRAFNHSQHVFTRFSCAPCAGNTFVRLIVGTPTSFCDAVASLLPVRSAAIATYIVAQAGGAALAPLALLCSHTQRGLLSCSEACAARLVLEAISALPDALRASVGNPVFLEPAKAVLSDAHCQLLAAARGNQQHEHVLRSLGFRLGITGFAEALTVALREEVEEHAVYDPNQAGACNGNRNGVARASDQGGAAKENNGAGTVGKALSNAAPARADETAMTANLPLASQVPLIEPGNSLEGMAMETTLTLCKRVAEKFGGGLEAQLDSQGQGALSELRDVTVLLNTLRLFPQPHVLDCEMP